MTVFPGNGYFLNSVLFSLPSPDFQILTLKIMDYLDLYNLLDKKVNLKADEIVIDEFMTVHNLLFKSKNWTILQGGEPLWCQTHNLSFNDDIFRTDLGYKEEGLDLIDSEVNENKAFIFHIFEPQQQKNEKEAILLMHGFNEKSWKKYYPWAYRLARETGQCVVLCPMAFHMNRALSAWSDRHLMHRVSQTRKEHFPDLLQSSFSNVAISTRLQSKPQRFIWSGLQTYHDIVQFLDEVKDGKYPPLTGQMQFHFFSYSIGTFLSEILKLTNPKGYFTHSKLLAFCGGPTFNRLTPVSKAILDSEANVALYSYLVEHLESHLKHEKRLYHYMEEHPEGRYFRMMLDFKVRRQEREKRFREISADIFAIALAQDEVIPAYDVVSTLQGAAHDIPTQVIIADFDYSYSHESPFVNKESVREKVDAAFNQTFDRFCAFLTDREVR
jgi:hypothetical protein